MFDVKSLTDLTSIDIFAQTTKPFEIIVNVEKCGGQHSPRHHTDTAKATI